jgi:hypothetical protein
MQNNVERKCVNCDHAEVCQQRVRFNTGNFVQIESCSNFEAIQKMAIKFTNIFLQEALEKRFPGLKITITDDKIRIGQVTIDYNVGKKFIA